MVLMVYLLSYLLSTNLRVLGLYHHAVLLQLLSNVRQHLLLHSGYQTHFLLHFQLLLGTVFANSAKKLFFDKRSGVSLSAVSPILNV
jgi:hypothetical protein